MGSSEGNAGCTRVAIVNRGLDLDELEARLDEVDDEERARLRPDVIEAVQRGMRRTLERA